MNCIISIQWHVQIIKIYINIISSLCFHNFRESTQDENKRIDCYPERLGNVDIVTKEKCESRHCIYDIITSLSPSNLISYYLYHRIVAVVFWHGCVLCSWVCLVFMGVSCVHPCHFLYVYTMFFFQTNVLIAILNVLEMLISWQRRNVKVDTVFMMS
jgi:hypothetical protein